MVPADSRPSYDELAALVALQAKRIAELEAEVAELRRQLGMNSQNSSKPPRRIRRSTSRRRSRCAAAAAAGRAASRGIRGPPWRWSMTRTSVSGTSPTATGVDTVGPDALADQVRLFRSATQVGITETAARSTKTMQKHNALARRLRERQHDYLRFTTDLRITPDNNGSERDIRMIKLRQKMSGCMRTLAGAKQFCAIRSYLSTTAKHGRTTSTPSSCSPRRNLAARNNLTSYVWFNSREHTR